MLKFRKKPVVIEAIQLPMLESDMPRWASPEGPVPDGRMIFKRDNYGRVCEAVISTLEGTMIASHGDWIIRGVRGELYPCKPDIFAATYDPVIEPHFGILTGV